MSISIRRLCTVLSAAVLAAAAGAGCSPEAAEEDPPVEAAVEAEELREILTRGFEEHRQMDLEYVRAVPDSALRWAPYPDVRDYAEQIEHIVADHVLFVARAVVDEEPPSLGDTAVYLNDKDELERVVDDAYAYTLEALEEISAEELLAPTELFDEERARWRVFLLALHHADWTRGQLVPYLRLNDVDPPGWRAY